MPHNEKNSQPSSAAESQIDSTEIPEVSMQAAAIDEAKQKSRWRAFWDFFVLFSGISTKSNLSRTRKEPVLSRGLFLFRSRRPR